MIFTSLNSLAIMLVTSSSGEEPHDSVSSIVDCASDTDDNRIIGRQITTAIKARLYDMLFHCSVTGSTDYARLLTLLLICSRNATHRQYSGYRIYIKGAAV